MTKVDIETKQLTQDGEFTIRTKSNMKTREYVTTVADHGDEYDPVITKTFLDAIEAHEQMIKDVKEDHVYDLSYYA